MALTLRTVAVTAGMVLWLLIPASITTLLQPTQGFGPALSDVPASLLLIRIQPMRAPEAFEETLEHGL
jgi:hypothetical protein